MPEDSRSASNSDRPALTDSDRAQLVYTVRRSARAQGLSASVTDRYQAWIFVFVSWCHRHPPHQVDRSRIGAFQESLQRCAAAGEEEVHEAMDALAFLFGAADEVMSLLASPDATSGTRSGDQDEMQTLQVGWQAGPEASGDTVRAPQIPLERAPDTTVTRATDAEDEEEETEEASSTAELCIERFQTQVESLHASDADPAGSEGDRDVGAHPEPTAPSS